MKAVYAGSFDPFTKGHMDIVREASLVFEEVDIVIAVNQEKKRRISKELARGLIIKSTILFPNVSVVFWEGLIAEYCQKEKVNYLLRDIRNTTDYLYEEEVAKVNQVIAPNLRTIYLRAVNGEISSSMVWELFKQGYDVSAYLPYGSDCLK